MDDKTKAEVLALLAAVENEAAPAPAPVEEKADESALIHSSTDRLPKRPFDVTLENGTVVTHN